MALDPVQVAVFQQNINSGTGRTRRRKPAEPKDPPSLQYRLEIQRLVSAAIRVIQEEVKTALGMIELEAANSVDRGDSLVVRVDQVDSLIERIIENVRVRIGAIFSDERLAALADVHGQTVNRFTEGEIRRQLSSVLGIDVGSTATLGREKVRLFVRENVSLIKTIPETLLGQVERTLTNGARRGLRAGVMAKEIEARFKTTRNRARFIARDQVNKLSAELNRDRQQAVGVDSYFWRNSRDARVRGNPTGLYPNARFNHWSRQGQLFRWDTTPPDGHPGEAPGCRCRAEPNFEALLSELEV